AKRVREIRVALTPYFNAQLPAVHAQIGLVLTTPGVASETRCSFLGAGVRLRDGSSRYSAERSKSPDPRHTRRINSTRTRGFHILARILDRDYVRESRPMSTTSGAVGYDAEHNGYARSF